ncbi:MAG TPA: NAD+ synthase, partial [Candidatus Altiarchaeales archaeon]|nr:NAD+ synthase [Candidatus Altiarchaeales archaeon]
MYDFRVVLAQINPVVGDLEHNTKKIISAIREAEKIKADLICFPELALTGYPPEDLLLKPQFIEDNLEALQRIIKKTKDITAIVGFVDMDDDIYNAAAIIYNQ